MYSSYSYDDGPIFWGPFSPKDTIVILKAEGIAFERGVDEDDEMGLGRSIATCDIDIIAIYRKFWPCDTCDIIASFGSIIDRENFIKIWLF